MYSPRLSLVPLREAASNFANSTFCVRGLLATSGIHQVGILPTQSQAPPLREAASNFANSTFYVRGLLATSGIHEVGILPTQRQARSMKIFPAFQVAVVELGRQFCRTELLVLLRKRRLLLWFLAANSVAVVLTQHTGSGHSLSQFLCVFAAHGQRSPACAASAQRIS